MITGDLRNKIDRIWETFWTGGITNPLDVIEQFTYLLFIKQLDDVETTKENEANFLGVEYETLFPEECQKYRWSKFKNLCCKTFNKSAVMAYKNYRTAKRL